MNNSQASKSVKSSNQKNLVIGCLSVVGLIAIICIGVMIYLSFTQIDTPEEYVKEYGGSVEQYRMILSFPDCASSQDAFNMASTNINRLQPGTPAYHQSTGIMAAADQRMKELGCYK